MRHLDTNDPATVRERTDNKNDAVTSAKPKVLPRRELLSRAYPRKAEIARAVEAAKSCGIEVTAIEVSFDGSIKVFGAGADPTTQSEFDKWDKAGRL
jgi:hypothetical protein